jgi:O-antigen/teichoic acid export membrane protein
MPDSAATPLEGQPPTAQHQRHRSLSLAVVTSLLSKGGNFLLILIAMPLAYRVLGEERFGVFSALQLLMWLFSMADLGIGAGLARRLTLATSNQDRADQQRVMSTGFFMMTSLVCTAALIAAVVIYCVPVETLYGEKFGPYATELRMNLWLSLALFSTLMVVGILLKIREAYQEIHIFNLYGAVGNVVAAGLLFFGINHVPQVWFILVAIYGVQVVTWGSNSVLALKQRPWLIPSWKRFELPLAKALCTEGLGFFILVGLTPIFGREWIRWLLGQYFSPEVVGRFAILAQLGYIVFGLVFMVTYPLRPAIVDAMARADFAWLAATRRRLYKFWFMAAAGVPLGLYFLGPWLIGLWFQKTIPLTQFEVGCYGCFFVLTIWTEIHCVLLSGLGQVRAAAIIAALECAAVGLGAWIGVSHGGLASALIGAAVGMLCTSFLLLPRLWKRSLTEAVRAHSDC